ncbi:lipocalin family protein [Luteibacter yeojuensis]|nr:lipocalin family protein [Luteibacter yeojuensis]
MNRIPAALILMAGVAAAGCAADAPLKTVNHVDLPRYMGTWYVIGAMPNMFENGKVATADEYQLRPDGTIDNWYHYRKGFDAPPKKWHGKAWLPDPKDASRWKVQLLWPFRSDYTILALSDDYRVSLVGLPSRKLLWVLSKDPVIDDGAYHQLLEQARAQGFPVEKMRKVPQRPEDAGKPGYLE